MVVLACALAFILAAAGIGVLRNEQQPTHRAQPGNLIVVAMPGLTWSDINPDTTPALWGFAHRSAVGNQLVRAISAHSCSNAAWTTLGSGTRTALGYSPEQAPSSGTNDYCPPLVRGVANEADGTYSYPQWRTWAKSARHRNLPSQMGLVASALEASGECVAAVGEGAALGAANRQGEVSHYFPTLAKADFTACPVTYVSVENRSDEAFSDILRRAPAEATLVVTGLTDDERPESPRTLMVGGPTIRQGVLRSRSTRQPGLVQTTDLSAFILERVNRSGKAPVLGEGRPLSVEDHTNETSVKMVVNQSRLLRMQHDMLVSFYRWLGTFILAALAVGAWLSFQARRHRASPSVARRWWAGSAALVAAQPVTAFLVNVARWYDSSQPMLALGMTSAAFSIPLAALALVGPWRRWTSGPTVFLAAVTSCVLALDAFSGAPLQLVSMMGLQPVYGGRFSGMGNVGYALLMTSTLLVAAVLAGRYRAFKRPRLAALTVAVIGGAALLIDAVPQIGNDGGGSAAFVPPLAYLVMRARGIKITLTKLVLGAVSAAVFALLIAWLDYLRGPANRTHVGDVFAGLIGDGQINPFKRIIYANFSMLTSKPVFLLVPLALVVSAVVVAFPDGPGRFLKPLFVRIPMLRHGLIAIVMMWALGFIANDSGTSIPGVGLFLLSPLLVLLRCGVASPRASEAPRGPSS